METLATPAAAPAIGDDAASRLFSRIDRLAIPIAIGFSVIAFLRFAIASSRRLWFDEIYTSMVVYQPTWADFWKAYYAPADVQSPLFYWVSRISWLALGRNELALRMPEILGVLVFSWCMFLFVGKRLGRVFGLCAMILPLVTNLELGASQARPYGMMLAACGLAMLAWRNAVENPKRGWALALFAGSLALIVSCHAYAAAAVPVFGLAELYRTVHKRVRLKGRIDWGIWLCFLAVLPPIIPYLQLREALSHLDGLMGPTKWSHWSNIAGFYEFFFKARENTLILYGLLLGGLALLRKGGKPRTEGMPGHEIVLSAVLALSPVFSVALAMFTTRYYMARYSIFAMGGVIAVAIIVLDRVAPERRVASLMLLCSAVLLYGRDYSEYTVDSIKKRDAELEIPFSKVPPGIPLVIASGLAVLPADMYGSDGDLAHTYYLTDRALDIKYTGSAIFNFGKNVTDFYHFRLHLMDYSTFIRTHKTFVVYGNFLWEDDWQLKKLRDDGARIVEKGKYGGDVVENYLYEVTMP